MVKIPRQNLRVPGPTPVPDDIVEAMSQPMINHRGPEFREIITRTTEQLKQVFMTQGDVYVLTASGTGALEASVVNTLSPGDKVLAASAGSFRRPLHRDRRDLRGAGAAAQVRMGQSRWTRRQSARHWSADPEIKAVLVTHNETSTGITHPVEAIAGVVKGEFDKLLLVDAVSGLGCVPLPTDGWRCDVVSTASQKGFMVPPGLAFVSMSEAAHAAQESATMPRYYFDLEAAQSYLDRGETPFTPNVAALYGLSLALDTLLAEGMENVFERHVRIGQMTRDGVKDLGLELLAQDERWASNAVTAVKVPEGIDGGKLVSLARTEHSVVLAGGQGKLSGKIFRIGHMGLGVRGRYPGSAGHPEGCLAQGWLQRFLRTVRRRLGL